MAVDEQLYREQMEALEDARKAVVKAWCLFITPRKSTGEDWLFSAHGESFEKAYSQLVSIELDIRERT